MKTGNLAIGIFVVGGLLLFGIGMFLIGDRHQAFARHNEYYAEFANLGGLAEGAKVRVAGMDAGQVLAIDVPDSPSSRFRVKWRIDAKLSGLVRTDSVVTIGTEGVVGGTYLSVRPGSPQAPQAAALAIIPSKEPTELSDVMAQGAALVNDARGTLKKLTSTISDVDDVVIGLKDGRGTAGMLLQDEALADRIRQAVTTTSADVQDVLADLKAGRGAAGALLRDEHVADDVRDAVKNVQRASADLREASRQAGALVSDLKSQQIPQRAGEAMDKLNDSAQQLHQVISDTAKPDRQGVTAGVNIRESLTNANTATSNLAEASEALKHNFFLRGFFKRRGYYNLADLSPEKYRGDRAFASRTEHRAWLPGSELFQAGSNGEETLSSKGKTVLNTTLAQFGFSVFESPIVIEGYWNGGVSADQIRLSRTRAMLVQQYLETHFQLERKNVGIVPMKNLPPIGTDRATWDGICVVILRRN